MNYMYNTGTVDFRHQLQEYYHDRRCSKRWYKFVLHFLLNVSSIKNSKPYNMASEPSCTVHKDTWHKKKLIAGTNWNIHITEARSKKESLFLGTVSQKMFHLLEKLQDVPQQYTLHVQKKNRAHHDMEFKSHTILQNKISHYAEPHASKYEWLLKLQYVQL